MCVCVCICDCALAVRTTVNRSSLKLSGVVMTKLLCWSYCTPQLWIYHSVLLGREDRPGTGLPPLLFVVFWNLCWSVHWKVHKLLQQNAGDNKTATQAFVKRGFQRVYCTDWAQMYLYSIKMRRQVFWGGWGIGDKKNTSVCISTCPQDKKCFICRCI